MTLLLNSNDNGRQQVKSCVKKLIGELELVVNNDFDVLQGVGVLVDTIEKFRRLAVEFRELKLNNTSKDFRNQLKQTKKNFNKNME